MRFKVYRFPFCFAVPAVVILLLLSACGGAAVEPSLTAAGTQSAASTQSAPDAKKYPEALRIDYKLRVQPWPVPGGKARVSVDGKVVRAPVIGKQKTMATLRVPLVFEVGRGELKLSVDAPGYRESVRIVSREEAREPGRDLKMDATKNERRRLTPLIALDRKDSRLRFVEFVSTGSRPKSVTFLDADRVSMPLLGDDGVDVYDLRKREMRRVSPDARDARIGGFVESLPLPGRDEFWVTQMHRNSIHIFGLGDLKYRRTIKTGGHLNKFLVHDAARGLVYQSNWISKDVSVIDLKTEKELYRIHIGRTPRGMVLSADGTDLFVTEFGPGGAGTLARVSLAEKKIRARYAGAGAGAKRHVVMDAAGKRLFVSDMLRRRLEVLDAGSGKLLKTVPLSHNPNGVALAPDGSLVFVSCRGPNNKAGYELLSPSFGYLHVIDAHSLKTLEVIEGGHQPTGLDVSPNGNRLVFSDFQDNGIRVYEILRAAGNQ